MHISKGTIVGSEWMIDEDAHKEGQLNIESDSDPSLPSPPPQMQTE